MTDPRKLAVELVVEEHGLDEAESRIKDEFDDDDRRHDLVGHARKFASKFQVAGA